MKPKGEKKLGIDLFYEKLQSIEKEMISIRDKGEQTFAKVQDVEGSVEVIAKALKDKSDEDG